jgi:hypothetical protein
MTTDIKPTSLEEAMRFPCYQGYSVSPQNRLRERFQHCDCEPRLHICQCSMGSLPAVGATTAMMVSIHAHTRRRHM